ncbi:hypothetical protein Tco_0949803, partial [Tanacetum coccineum]
STAPLAVLKQTTRTLVVTLAAKRTLVLIYNKSERTLFSETKPKVHLYSGCKTTRTLGRWWRWCEGGVDRGGVGSGGCNDDVPMIITVVVWGCRWVAAEGGGGCGYGVVRRVTMVRC